MDQTSRSSCLVARNGNEAFPAISSIVIQLMDPTKLLVNRSRTEHPILSHPHANLQRAVLINSIQEYKRYVIDLSHKRISKNIWTGCLEKHLMLREVRRASDLSGSSFKKRAPFTFHMFCPNTHLKCSVHVIVFTPLSVHPRSTRSVYEAPRTSTSSITEPSEHPKSTVSPPRSPRNNLRPLHIMLTINNI